MPRILITRAPHQASALAEGLRAHGFETILIPTIELADPTNFAPLDTALASLSTFHWLLFTSANAVEAFTKRVDSPMSITQRNLAAIGQATARAIQQLLGTEPTIVPPQAVAESLAEALLPHARQPDGTPTRFLLIRAEEARDILPDTLRKAGGEVTIAPAYRTIVPQDSIPLIRSLFHSPATYPDAITFTSSSTVTNLLTLLAAANLKLPPDIKCISIGPITTQTMNALNIPPHAEANESTIPALIAQITSIFT
jgi:uroporphyrinogen-III synthase